MFIHVGGDIILRAKDIIAIFNPDICESSPITKEFLEAEEERKRKTIITADYIKSIVVTNYEVFYSPVSTSTLNKRAFGQMMIDTFFEKEEFE